MEAEARDMMEWNLSLWIVNIIILMKIEELYWADKLLTNGSDEKPTIVELFSLRRSSDDIAR